MPYVLRRPLLAGALFFIGLMAVRRAVLGPPRPPAGDVSSLAGGRAGVLRGKVLSPPQRRGPLTSYVVQASAWQAGPWEPFVPVEGRVLVGVPGRPPEVDWGDEALFWGRLKPLRGPALPGAYNERRVMGERRAFCRLAARPAGGQVLRPLGKASPLWWVVQARRRFARAFARLGPEARAVTAGLVLGERPSGHPQLQEDFRRSGTIHLLVASGTNVAFLLSLWWLAGRWVFFLSRRATLAFSVPLAFFYAFLAGADAPVLRAAFMAAVGVAGLLLGRVDRPLHALGFAFLSLLALDPAVFFQAGFQMSFAATAGLTLGMPAAEAVLRWAAARPFWPASRPARFLLTWTARLFAASALSQLALAPLLIFYFRRFSPAGLGANLFAVPWGGLCLFLGAGLFFVDLLGLPGAGLWAAATEKAVLVLWKGAAWAGRWPGAEVFLPWTGWQVAILSVAVAGTLVFLSGVRPAEVEEGLPPPPVGRRTLALLLAGWAAAGAAMWAARPAAPRQALVAWPGDAGSSVVVVAVDGGATLIDPDSGEDVRRVFLPFLRELRARPRRVVFTRVSPKREEIAAALPGVEILCAFHAPPQDACAAWPVGAAREDPGLSWGRPSIEALSLTAGGSRFLFMSGDKDPAPAGAWDAVVLRARGPVRRLESRLGRVHPAFWVLRGRGGARWEEGRTEPVHRPARDGWLIWRGGKWERDLRI